MIESLEVGSYWLHVEGHGTDEDQFELTVHCADDPFPVPTPAPTPELSPCLYNHITCGDTITDTTLYQDNTYVRVRATRGKKRSVRAIPPARRSAGQTNSFPASATITPRAPQAPKHTRLHPNPRYGNATSGGEKLFLLTVFGPTSVYMTTCTAYTDFDTVVRVFKE